MLKYNKSVNKVEKVIADPNVSDDGYIWFNVSDKSFKIKANGVVKKVVLLDDTEDGDLREYLNKILNEFEMIVNVENLKHIEINHGLGIKEFMYSVFDDDENQYIMVSADVIDENNIAFDFVDMLNGKIYIKFNVNR